MGVAPGASPQTPASTIRVDPFVRALICWQALRSTWADRLSGAHRRVAVWGHRPRRCSEGLPRGHPPGIGPNDGVLRDLCGLVALLKAGHAMRSRDITRETGGTQQR